MSRSGPGNVTPLSSAFSPRSAGTPKSQSLELKVLMPSSVDASSPSSPSLRAGKVPVTPQRKVAQKTNLASSYSPIRHQDIELGPVTRSSSTVQDSATPLRPTTPHEFEPRVSRSPITMQGRANPPLPLTTSPIADPLVRQYEKKFGSGKEIILTASDCETWLNLLIQIRGKLPDDFQSTVKPDLQKRDVILFQLYRHVKEAPHSDVRIAWLETLEQIKPFARMIRRQKQALEKMVQQAWRCLDDYVLSYKLVERSAEYVKIEFIQQLEERRTEKPFSRHALEIILLYEALNVWIAAGRKAAVTDELDLERYQNQRLVLAAIDCESRSLDLEAAATVMQASPFLIKSFYASLHEAQFVQFKNNFELKQISTVFLPFHSLGADDRKTLMRDCVRAFELAAKAYLRSQGVLLDQDTPIQRIREEVSLYRVLKRDLKSDDVWKAIQLLEACDRISSPSELQRFLQFILEVKVFLLDWPLTISPYLEIVQFIVRSVKLRPSLQDECERYISDHQRYISECKYAATLSKANKDAQIYASSMLETISTLKKTPSTADLSTMVSKLERLRREARSAGAVVLTELLDASPILKECWDRIRTAPVSARRGSIPVRGEVVGADGLVDDLHAASAHNSFRLLSPSTSPILFRSPPPLELSSIAEINEDSDGSEEGGFKAFNRKSP